MTFKLTRRGFGGIAATALATPWIARAAEPIRLRCSLDTAPTHTRNVSIATYFQKLEAASDGRLKTEIFSSGALFADVNVVKALVQGQVEMACPGTWTMTGFIPDFDFVNLPALYAQPVPTVRKAIDGKTGALLGDELRNKLKLRVLGPWLELGAEHWYTSKQKLTGFADLKGLKIRNAGGALLAWRTKFFDAVPNTTAWPDVPLALSQGTFDGLISTNESCFSAKLWEAGLKYSIQDRQNINIYVPLVSDKFFASLPDDVQKLMVDLWHDNIGTFRDNMAAAQEHALSALRDHGLEIVTPDETEVTAVRKRMLPDQDKLVKDNKMSADLPKLLEADVGALA
jgi:C4-dicarboxylate-binding protein DctP